MVEKNTESEIALANRKTTGFCRYKKTYYLTIILAALFIIAAIFAVFQIMKNSSQPVIQKSKPIRKMASPTVVTSANAPITPTSNFLENLLTQLD